MNFGVKITILYLSFVGLILTLVVLSYSYDIELVSKDYYAQELKYQDKIDAINNANSLNGSIHHLITESSVVLSIDSAINFKDFKGEVVFFRPSDFKKDVKMKLNFINNTQTIDLKNFEKGVYKMQLSWSSNNKQFFKEEVINIVK